MNCGIFFACVGVLFLSSQSSDAYTSNFKSGVNGFSNEFFEVLAKNTEGNLLTSPFSALTVLYMGILGASGDTFQEARNALEISVRDGTIMKDYKNFILNLQNTNKIELYLANKMFVENEFKLQPYFPRLIEGIFQSQVEKIDFTNTQVAADKINAWCQDETRNKIKSIIKPDDLVDALMVMVNAIYFKGQWVESFNSELEDHKFHLSNNHAVVVPMMCTKVTNAMPFLDSKAYYIELPYETDPQNEMSMYIIYPWGDNTVDTIVDQLPEIDFTQLDDPWEEMDFCMPKFKVESELDIIPTLQAMGFKRMFNDDADFTHISAMHNLKIGRMIQKGVLSVDENGSEAAVVTADVFMDRGGFDSFKIIVDKPFLAAIVKKDTGTPLFWARINDPRNSISSNQFQGI